MSAAPDTGDRPLISVMVRVWENVVVRSEGVVIVRFSTKGASMPKRGSGPNCCVVTMPSAKVVVVEASVSFTSVVDCPLSLVLVM